MSARGDDVAERWDLLSVKGSAAHSNTQGKGNDPRGSLLDYRGNTEGEGIEVGQKGQKT